MERHRITNNINHGSEDLLDSVEKRSNENYLNSPSFVSTTSPPLFTTPCAKLNFEDFCNHDSGKKVGYYSQVGSLETFQDDSLFNQKDFSELAKLQIMKKTFECSLNKVEIDNKLIASNNHEEFAVKISKANQTKISNLKNLQRCLVDKPRHKLHTVSDCVSKLPTPKVKKQINLIASGEDVFPLETDFGNVPIKRKYQSPVNPENQDFSLVRATKRLKISGRVYSATAKPVKSNSCESDEFSDDLFENEAFEAFPVRENESINITFESIYIGDLTRQSCFPVFKNTFHDLMFLSHHVLARVLEYHNTNETSQLANEEMLKDKIHQQLIPYYKDHKKYFLIVIDCRYPYEYTGGHIKNAINLYNKEFVKEYFLKQRSKIFLGERIPILIFHCEFSSKRGPKMARFLRNEDRIIHREIYPKLYYPEIYILKGGYKDFFSEYSKYCEPNNYVTMWDRNFTNERVIFTRKQRPTNYVSLGSKNKENLVQFKKRIL